MRILLLLAAGLYAGFGAAADPHDLLARYADEARKADPGFTGFSAERGRAFYFQKHTIEDGREIACASCHHADPRRRTIAHENEFPCRSCHMTLRDPTGKPSPLREIAPMAPSANHRRFTKAEKTESWFSFNCKRLLQRECTPTEKGDFITWLLTFN